MAILAPRFAVAQGTATYARLLVLVELKGGNDGLNTVVPYADAAYYRLRPRIAIRRDEVLQLDDATGLHPALEPLHAALAGARARDRAGRRLSQPESLALPLDRDLGHGIAQR